ncbi:unnamed protein product [Somion occarium]|uniref:Protein kinase domain-containing protein n=1 Tax=Somion occarium TaxID=3059160 RepID=A0ABP1CWL6_9APHY
MDEPLVTMLGELLLERRAGWAKLNLDPWFDITSELDHLSKRLDDIRRRLQAEGMTEGDIQLEQHSFIQTLTMTVQGQTDTLESMDITMENFKRDSVLAQMLSDSFMGSVATVENADHGIACLLELALESELHKNILVAFRGSAAEYVLSLMMRPGKDEPSNLLSHLWREHRSTLLRLLLKLAKCSEIIPRELFLDGVDCMQRENPVGHGGNADVFLATYRGRPVVLKRLRIFQNVREGREDMQEFCREALIWFQLSHPFVQPFLGVDCETFPNQHCMVTYWMEYGNINTCMRSLTAGRKPLPLDRWLREIALGLEYLHHEQVIHGDIRGNNILIDNDMHVRITDFGLAAYQGSNTMSVGDVGGSRRWMAPALFDPEASGKPSRESDVYAFGMTCIEIYTQQKPFPSISNEYQVTAHVLAGGRPSRSIGGESYGAMSDALWEVVRLCWAGLPSERPSMSEILMAFRTTSGQWNTDPGVFQTYTITELPTRPVYATALSFMLFLHSIYLILSVSYLLSAPMEDGVIVVKRLVFVFFNLTLSFTFALAELMAKHLHLRNRTTHPSHSQIRGFSIAMISLLSWAFIFIGGAISTRDNTLVTAASMNLIYMFVGIIVFIIYMVSCKGRLPSAA